MNKGKYNFLQAYSRREISPASKETVSQELLFAAEDNLVTKKHAELSCEMPGIPRSTFLMVFSPDGTKVASTHGNHNVYVTDMRTGKNINTLVGHPRTPWCIAFHPSSNQILATGCLGGQVRIWDLSGGSEVWTAECQTVIASLAFHPSDRLLVIATFNELYFWDWSQPKPFVQTCTSNIKEKVRYVAFDRLGHKLITGIANAPPSRWDRARPPYFTVSHIDRVSQPSSISSNRRAWWQSPSSQVHPMHAELRALSDQERTITFCYRTLVQQYESLMQRYLEVYRTRNAHTTDRGTDPMDFEATTSTSSASAPPVSATENQNRHQEVSGPNISESQPSLDGWEPLNSQPGPSGLAPKRTKRPRTKKEVINLISSDSSSSDSSDEASTSIVRQLKAIFPIKKRDRKNTTSSDSSDEPNADNAKVAKKEGNTDVGSGLNSTIKKNVTFSTSPASAFRPTTQIRLEPREHETRSGGDVEENVQITDPVRPSTPFHQSDNMRTSSTNTNSNHPSEANTARSGFVRFFNSSPMRSSFLTSLWAMRDRHRTRIRMTPTRTLGESFDDFDEISDARNLIRTSDPISPIDLSASTGPLDPNGPVDPTISMDPTGSVDPAGSMDPSGPLDSAGSIDPTAPIDPTVDHDYMASTDRQPLGNTQERPSFPEHRFFRYHLIRQVEPRRNVERLRAEARQIQFMRWSCEEVLALVTRNTPADEEHENPEMSRQPPHPTTTDHRRPPASSASSPDDGDTAGPSDVPIRTSSRHRPPPTTRSIHASKHRRVSSLCSRLNLTRAFHMLSSIDRNRHQSARRTYFPRSYSARHVRSEAPRYDSQPLENMTIDDESVSALTDRLEDLIRQIRNPEPSDPGSPSESEAAIEARLHVCWSRLVRLGGRSERCNPRYLIFTGGRLGDHGFIRFRARQILSILLAALTRHLTVEGPLAESTRALVVLLLELAFVLVDSLMLNVFIDIRGDTRGRATVYDLQRNNEWLEREHSQLRARLLRSLRGLGTRTHAIRRSTASRSSTNINDGSLQERLRRLRSLNISLVDDLLNETGETSTETSRSQATTYEYDRAPSTSSPRTSTVDDISSDGGIRDRLRRLRSLGQSVMLNVSLNDRTSQETTEAFTTTYQPRPRIDNEFIGNINNSTDNVPERTERSDGTFEHSRPVPQVQINDVPVVDPTSAHRTTNSPTTQRLRFGGMFRPRFLHPLYSGINPFDADMDEPQREQVFGVDTDFPAAISPNHRIQVWNVSNRKIPNITNPEKNVVVAECKIHNDASVDISRDGNLLVTLLPSGGYLNITNKLGVFSIRWDTLGQCLYTASFEQNAVSVSLSATSRYLAVGLASRRVSLVPGGERCIMAQLYRLSEDGCTVLARDIEKTRDLGYTSLNCIRWSPVPGQGLVYATNTGQLKLLT